MPQYHLHYINHNNFTSKIDHFLATDLLKDIVSNCSIIDNHLYSDHVPICIEFNINVTPVQEEIRPYTTKQAWYKASEQDLSIYKDRFDELLTDITVDDSLLLGLDTIELLDMLSTLLIVMSKPLE